MSRSLALSEEAEAFLASLAERGRSGHTVAAYRRDLAAYERFLAGRGVPVAAAAAGDVDAYVEELSASGRRPASVTRALVAVRALHRSFGSEAAAGVGAPEAPAVAPAVLTEEEVAALLASVRGHSAGDRRDLALLELLYATGARISEVVGLAVDDVAGGVARLGGPRARAVPYGAAAARALEAWLAPGGRPVMTGTAGRRTTPDEAALFVNARGGRLSRQWGWAVVKDRAAARLDGPHGPHVLRHSFAAHLSARGAPAGVVQQLLNGHPAVLAPAALAEAYARWHPRA